MKQSSIVGFVAMCFLLLQDCTGKQNNNSEINYIDVPIFTGCGGVLPLFWNGGEDVAIIVYKDGIPYSENEFCVWTFLAEDNARGIRIDFTNTPTRKEDGIVVYTWKDSNFTSHKIPPGGKSLTIDAQHFAVAFSSDSGGQSSGFNFLVYVLAPGDAVTTPKAYFSEQSKGEFQYPKIVGQGIYDNDKRVSVVLHGPLETPRKSIEYILSDLDTETSNDFVEVYVLWPYNRDTHYKFVGRFSGQKSGPVAKSDIITPFPVLYLFSSNRNVTGKGFTITWSVFGSIGGNGDFMVQK